MHTALKETIHERLGAGMLPIAVMLFDMGVHYGLGQPWEPPLDSSARAVADAVKACWHGEMSVMRAWLRDAAPGETPDWLKEAIERHATAQREVGAPTERQVAFGPAPLPPTCEPIRRGE